MPTGRSLPTDALAFIRRCVRERKVYWTYHVNMRLFHVLFAADVSGDNVRIVTAYRPNTDEWEADLKSRKGRK